MNDTRLLPIASAFKLWILDALAREVAAGRATWDEEFEVSATLRSDPTGEIYSLADKTPVTLRRYASLMISISDNTAADHLLARLGRDRVEAAIEAIGVTAADRNLPLLSTADMARLKFVSPAAGEEYLQLKDVPDRRAYLERLPASVPFPWTTGGSAADVDVSRPVHVDVLEWFATAADLCRTMADLDRLAAGPNGGPIAEILSLNPGLPPDVAKPWSEVRFKGGSEPGVLMYVYWLRRNDGAARVVVINWSDLQRLIADTPATEKAFRLIHGLAAG